MKDYVIQRGGQEIFDLLADVTEQTEEGGTRKLHKTYEDGIREGFAWLFGETEEHPYDEVTTGELECEVLDRCREEAPHSPGRANFARRELEDLSTRCLSAAATAAFIAAGSDPDRVDWASAGRIAVLMAFTIRMEVGRRLEEVLTKEGAEEMLAQLAISMAEVDRKGGE